jgi:diguanylate cyclase (GGDEF)-like protein
VPLTAQGAALGVLCLRLAASSPAAPGGQQRLAQTVADSLALAFSNLQLRDTLRQQSIRDVLTGMFNRRYMEESLEREIRRAARPGYPVGLIMLDLDHFKSFNDTFGHAAGDLLLRTVGEFLSVHIRAGDVACRFGGEEFVLILPEASLEITRQRAEHLREEIRHLNPEYRGQRLGPMTVSAGVAAYPTHGRDAEQLLRAADEALYLAKHAGRDRVAAAPRLAAADPPP